MVAIPKIIVVIIVISIWMMKKSRSKSNGISKTPQRTKIMPENDQGVYVNKSYVHGAQPDQTHSIKV